MKKSNKFMIILISTPVVILLFFVTNIYGYFRFKSYCASEGGLRVYEPLEKNVGWLAKDEYEARQVTRLDGVEFARYIEKKDGLTYDVIYIGGKSQRDESYKKMVADLSKPTIYEWRAVIHDSLQNEVRLNRFGYEVYLADAKKLAVRYHMFEYSVFENPLLGGSSSMECFHEGGNSVNDIPLSFKKIITAFKN